jgi:deazaflavin-dependent oxidoreductase (nitroreductase family)
MASDSDYNTRIIEEFRATGGHPGGEWAGIPMILIHHIGAKSGIERVTPLECFPLPGGRMAVVASNGGSPVHPDRSHNLKASSVITVEVGAETFTAVAGELAGTARAELWPKLVARYPALGGIPGQDHPPVPGVRPDPPGRIRMVVAADR